MAVPSHAEATRLVWSTLIAVDHATKTGNFSVLLDLAAPGFRAANDSERLRQGFAALAAQNADLSRTISLTPVFLQPPAIRPDGLLRLEGGFGSRPIGIHFDLLFERIEREWRILAIVLTPIVTNPVEATPDAGK